MSLKKVAEGEHEIRLVKKNYREWNQKVVVRSFQPTDVKATLEVSPGMLSVNSIPSDAKIYFKGKLVANTPHTLSNIPPGEVVVRVEKDGYEEWTTSVIIQPNQHEILDVVLKEKIGAITITSQPEDATVYLEKQGMDNGIKIGNTPILNYSTTIGNYSVRVEKEDYYSDWKDVVVLHEQLTDVNFSLDEKPGSIFVETMPTNVRIFLNGSYKGRSPFNIRDVSKGDYQITMSLPYAKKTEQVSVTANRQSSVKSNFKKSKRYLSSMTSIGVVAILFHLLAQ